MFLVPENEMIVVLLALGKQDEAEEIETKLQDKFPDNMEIYQAPTGFDAMSLSMNKPHVVMLDQRLPDVMGLDMIESIRDQIGKDHYLIFMGGAGKGGMRPGMRDEALKRGATCIIERPMDSEWVVKMVSSLLYPEVPDHPHLHGLELLDLIQMFHQKRCDRTLRIFANDGRVGSIFMNKGEITHVEAGSMRGFDAVIDLMRWTEGRIEVYDSLLSSEITNDQPTMHLIMEAARLMDEATPAHQEHLAHEEEMQKAQSSDDEPVGGALDAMGMDDLEEDFNLEAFDAMEENESRQGAPPEPEEEKEDNKKKNNSADSSLSIPALDLDMDLD